MKKPSFSLLSLLVAFTPLLSLHLMAEGTAATPVYVAQENPFKIGVAPEPPVYAPELVFFLEKKAAHEHSGVYSDYFDKSFMEKILHEVSPEYWSVRTASICRLVQSSHSTYSVIPGHEYDIICGLQSEEVQKEFNAWRNSHEWTKHPTLEEDCKYITSIVQSNSADAAAIKARYPEAKELFDQFDRSTYTSVLRYYHDENYTTDEPCRVYFGFYPNNSNTFSKKIIADFSILDDPINSFITYIDIGEKDENGNTIKRRLKYKYFIAREMGAHSAAGEEKIRFAPSELHFFSNIGGQANALVPDDGAPSSSDNACNIISTSNNCIGIPGNGTISPSDLTIGTTPPRSRHVRYTRSVMGAVEVKNTDAQEAVG